MTVPCNRRRFTVLGLAWLSSAMFLRAEQPAIPSDVGQLVVAVADGWNSSKGKLTVFQRTGPNAAWQQVWKKPVPVLFGKGGLAWGNGALPVPHGQGGIPSKQEKDQRAPAGIFRIGTLFGYAAQPPAGVVNPYYQITARDCWIDDPAHPSYNRHVVVDPDHPPEWYAKQRMRLGDFAYEFLLEIRHNADPPVPGHGSAIFFHIRRGVNTPTHGCTTMERSDLVHLVQTLRPALKPNYVLLPKAEYTARLKSWGLPPLPP